MSLKAMRMNDGDLDIAVVGMACRFPWASSYQVLWRRLMTAPSAPSSVGIDWQADAADIAQHVASEALHDAAIDHEAIAHDDVGLYIGTDSAHRQSLLGDIARQVGCRGPSLLVDVGSASSLLAIHTAARALRAGDCTLAIVGGISIESGQGSGFIVLQSLEDAIQQGRRIHALLRSSAAKTHASDGDVLRTAIARGSVALGDLDYVESDELGNVGNSDALRGIGRGRSPESPFLVGSLVGHMEAQSCVAGIAGLIKLALMMQNRQVPATCLPVDFDRRGLTAHHLEVSDVTQVWPRAGVLRGVLMGHGAHGVAAQLIVESAPASAPRAPSAESQLFVLSAPTQQSLQAYADIWVRALNEDPHLRRASWKDVAYTATARQSLLSERLALVATSVHDCANQLHAWTQRSPDATQSRPLQPKVAFVFPGHTANWHGMGVRLLEQEPVFRRTFEACDAVVRKLAHWSPLDGLRNSRSARYGKFEYARTIHLALQLALTDLWKSYGVRPAGTVGVSLGEVASAYASDALTLAQAMQVGWSQVSLLASQVGKSGVLSLETDRATAEQWTAASSDISVAFVTGSHMLGLSGPIDALLAVAAQARAQGVTANMLYDTPAVHSNHVDTMLPALRKLVQNVVGKATDTALYSSFMGQDVTDHALDAAYWTRSMRECVSFADALAAMVQDGFNVFVEIAAHPTLRRTIARALQESSSPGIAVASLRREHAERESLLQAAGALVSVGCRADFEKLFGETCLTVTGPSRPWNVPTRANVAEPAVVREPWTHDVTLSADAPRYLADHVVHGMVIAPAALYIDVVRTAAQKHLGTSQITLKNLVFAQALRLPYRPHTQLRVNATPAAQGFHFELLVLVQNQWRQLCAGDCATAQNRDSRHVALDSLRTLGGVKPASALYPALKAAGIDFGPSFQMMDHIAADAAQTFVTFSARRPELRDMGPLVLDGAWQMLALPQPDAVQAPLVPTGVDSIHFFAAGEARHSVIVWRGTQLPDARLADVSICTQDGRVLAQLEGVRFRQVSQEALSRSAGVPVAPSNWFARPTWEAKPLSQALTATTSHWLILGGDPAVAQSIAASLQGKDNVVIHAAERLDDATIERLLAGAHAATPNGQVGVLMLAPTQGATSQATSAATLMRDFEQSLRATLILSQAAIKSGHPLRVFLVTAGATSAGDGAVGSVAQTVFAGFARSLRAEHPDLWGGLVDLGPTLEPADVRGLIAEVQADTHGHEDVAYRRGVRYVARLTASHVNAQRAHWDTQGTYVVTGGLTGLGLRLADHLVGQGVSSLALVGRRVPGPQAAAAIERWRRDGVKVHVQSCDVARFDDVRKLLSTLAASMPPVRGILHGAAVAADAIVVNQTWSQFETVLAGKAIGAWNLHQASQHLDLHAFVMFSSIASVLGNAGQANYSAANAFLDGLAAHRHALGQPAISINWGQWDEVGMSMSTGRAKETAWDRRGAAKMPVEQALAALDVAVGSAHAQLIVSPLEAQRLAATTPDSDLALAFAGQVRPPRAAVKAPVATPIVVPATVSQPAAAPVQAPALPGDGDALSTSRVSRLVTEAVRSVLQLQGDTGLSLRQPLRDLGLDSLLSLELNKALSTAFACAIPATFAYDYPTIEAMQDYLRVHGKPVQAMAPQSQASTVRTAAAPVTAPLQTAVPTPERREPTLLSRTTAIVRDVLKVGLDVRLDVRQPLKEVGLDSLLSMELRNELNRVLGVKLPATFAFDHPTIEQMAKQLEGLAPSAEASPPTQAAKPAVVVQAPVVVAPTAVAPPVTSTGPVVMAGVPSAALAGTIELPQDNLLPTVTTVLREVLRLAPSQSIGLRQPFKELGMDSLLSLEFRNSLASSLRAQLPATLTFDYPNLESMLAYLKEKMASQRS